MSVPKPKVKALTGLPRTMAILYANQLGTVRFFVFCVLLVLVGIIGAVMPRLAWLVLTVSFISQTVIQLWSLPAIQLQSIEADTQRRQDHAALTEMLGEMQDILKEVHAIAHKEGLE